MILTFKDGAKIKKETIGRYPVEVLEIEVSDSDADSLREQLGFRNIDAEQIKKEIHELILDCKDECYTSGRNATNNSEGDYGTWDDWEELLVNVAIDYSCMEQSKEKKHEWKEGDRVQMKGCNKFKDDSVWKVKMEDGALYVSTGGHYDIRCYNQDHWTLIEEEKEHKWKVGDRVKMKKECNFYKEGDIAELLRDSDGALYATIIGDEEQIDCYNYNHWTLIEESSPEQNPKEIDFNIIPLGLAKQTQIDLENKINELVKATEILRDAMNRLQKGNSGISRKHF